MCANHYRYILSKIDKVNRKTIKMKKPEYLEPAKSVIALLGGVTKTAKVVCRNPGTVCKWRWAKTRGGTDGQIPSEVMPLIVKEARVLNRQIRLASILMGEHENVE